MRYRSLADRRSSAHDARLWLWRGGTRAALLTLIWWALSGGDPRSWLVGAPVVLAATSVSMALAPASRWRLSPINLAIFVPYFIWHSMKGSFDVAWRALHPGLPISPSLERFPFRLPAEGPPRVFFASVVNLLPGTLSAELHDDSVTIHLLNGASPGALKQLHRLELRVGALFGLRLRASPDLPERTDG